MAAIPILFICSGRFPPIMTVGEEREIVKTIGLIGGMSWVSTASYYRLINQAVRERLGGFHSAQIALWSVDFAEIERMQVAGEWDQAGALLADAAKRLERAGADVILI